MADYKTITSANSTCTVVVPGYYNSPQTVEGYGTDAAINTADITPTQVQMGVDGKLSAGFTPVPEVVTITLAADSPSRDLFGGWVNQMKKVREVLFCNMVFTLPGIQKKYVGTKGSITQYKTAPDANQVLQPSAVQITFESFVEQPL